MSMPLHTWQSLEDNADHREVGECGGARWKISVVTDAPEEEWQALRRDTEDLFPPPPTASDQSNNAGAVSEREDNGKRMRKKYRKRNEPISRETLQELFNLPLKEAAAFLNVGESTLKRICRKLEIEKWPFCKINKAGDQSVQSGMSPSTTVVAHDHEQNSASSKTSQVLQRKKSKQNVRKVTVKATYKGDTVRIKSSPTMEFTKLKNEIAKRWELKDSTFNIKYTDDDHDMILVSCDEDFKECISVFEKQGNDVVRLFVLDKITHSNR